MEERTSAGATEDQAAPVDNLASAKPAPSRLSLLRQIRKLGEAGRSCKAAPATIVGTALKSWCDTAFQGLPDPQLHHSKKLAATPALKVFVETLRAVSFLEASYWLSSAYAMLSEESERKRLAMFFTPASLTNGLLEDITSQGVDFASQTFLDPACGGAAFLAPIALRMRDSLRRQGKSARAILEHIETHLYGTDLDDTLCALSKQFLCMALHDEIRTTGFVPDFRVHQADSLSELSSMYGQIDVVVCNPPYRKMTATELEPLRAGYADVIESQPNLYGLFIALCVRLLREGGYAALVTPTSFLSGQYFAALRRFLVRTATVEHIGMVSDRLGVFIDVEQETALTVLRRDTSEAREEAWADVSVVSGIGAYQSVGRCLLPSTGAVWPIPRAVNDVQLLHAAAKAMWRLSDYGYRVRIGAYVWNRDERPKFASFREAKAARAHSAVPLIWSSDISVGGSVHVDPAGRPDGDPRFVDLGDKQHSSIVSRPSVVVQRVTSNDQPRRLVAAAVSPSVIAEYGGFVGENHVVILEQVTERPVLSPSKLSQLLGAHIVERYFRCISGATNVSAFELNQLALPDPQSLKECLSAGLSMDQAAASAFGVDWS
jgi:adenine-specific DNA-methyltransferase